MVHILEESGLELLAPLVYVSAWFRGHRGSLQRRNMVYLLLCWLQALPVRLVTRYLARGGLHVGGDLKPLPH